MKKILMIVLLLVPIYAHSEDKTCGANEYAHKTVVTIVGRGAGTETRVIVNCQPIESSPIAEKNPIERIEVKGHRSRYIATPLSDIKNELNRLNERLISQKDLNNCAK